MKKRSFLFLVVIIQMFVSGCSLFTPPVPPGQHKTTISMADTTMGIEVVLNPTLSEEPLDPNDPAYPPDAGIYPDTEVRLLLHPGAEEPVMRKYEVERYAPFGESAGALADSVRVIKDAENRDRVTTGIAYACVNRPELADSEMCVTLVKDRAPADNPKAEHSTQASSAKAAAAAAAAAGRRDRACRNRPSGGLSYSDWHARCGL